MMAHALDFDDNYAYDLQTRKKNGGHANITAVPAALAVAELKGSVSGKEFITAVALGVDLMLRLTFAAKGGRRGAALYTTADVLPAGGVIAAQQAERTVACRMRFGDIGARKPRG